MSFISITDIGQTAVVKSILLLRLRALFRNNFKGWFLHCCVRALLLSCASSNHSPVLCDDRYEHSLKLCQIEMLIKSVSGTHRTLCVKCIYIFDRGLTGTHKGNYLRLRDTWKTWTRLYLHRILRVSWLFHHSPWARTRGLPG